MRALGACGRLPGSNCCKNPRKDFAEGLGMLFQAVIGRFLGVCLIVILSVGAVDPSHSLGCLSQIRAKVVEFMRFSHGTCELATVKCVPEQFLQSVQ